MPSFGAHFRDDDDEEMKPQKGSLKLGASHTGPVAPAEGSATIHSKRDDARPADDEERDLPPAAASSTTTSANAAQKAMYPFLATAVAGIIVLFMVLNGAGAGSSGEARPKALIFIIGGMEASVFETAAVEGNRAPNFKQLLRQGGAHAPCQASSDTRCCRAQSGAKLGGSYSWTAAPGVASILTGVDAGRHRVYNSSSTAVLQFAATSQMYPTLLSRVKAAGLSTAAIGSGNMLTTVGAGSSACDSFGILDAECGAAALSRCMQDTSCNADRRFPVLGSQQLPGRGAQESTIAYAREALASGADLVVVEVSRTAVAATTTGNFSAQSRPYLAQLYLADALFGQLVELLKARTTDQHENWLVVTTSDHGGHDQSFGTMANRDDVVPLAASVISAAGRVSLAAPRPPVRHMDVTPTVLRWFDLLPTTLEAVLDGRPQFVCASGRTAGNCTAADMA